MIELQDILTMHTNEIPQNERTSNMSNLARIRPIFCPFAYKPVVNQLCPHEPNCRLFSILNIVQGIQFLGPLITCTNFECLRFFWLPKLLIHEFATLNGPYFTFKSFINFISNE